MPIISQLTGTSPQDLSLKGQQGPNFESEAQRTTSDIQALVRAGGALAASQDLLSGRTAQVAQAGFVVTPSSPRAFKSSFAPPSNPPVSFPDAFAGRPYYPSLGGVYKDKGPLDGRY